MKTYPDKFFVILFLGLGHGLNDLIAGYFLGSLVQAKTDLIQISIGLLMYNLLAFGGQYPVAIWMEKFQSPRRFLVSSYILNIAAIGIFTFLPQVSIVLSGIASAIYHVAGGSVCAEKNKAFNIGIFAAPGVAGLIMGGYFAHENIFINGWLLAAALIVLIFLITLSFPAAPSFTGLKEEKGISNKFRLDRHDYIMILLLTVISLRSVIWDIYQLIHENNYSWLIAIAAAAFVGKIAGGWLADRIGWRIYTFISLITAMPLITFFKNELLLFCIGIGLLQSGIPATTSLLILAMKGKKERAVGISFGAAIMIGAILFFSTARNLLLTNTFIWIIASFMLVILFFARNTNVVFRKGNEQRR